MNTKKDQELLAEYVATFDRHDEMLVFDAHPVLRVTPDPNSDTYGMEQWRPQQIITEDTCLRHLYRGLNLPGYGSTRFPALYESLILSYRWSEVDTGRYRLLTNEPDDNPSSSFASLLAAMRTDPALTETLIPNGYVPFAKGPDVDYDPVCFDFRHRQKDGDCRIVKLDHEAILCDWQIAEVIELAPSFRFLVLKTIHDTTAV